MVFYIQHTTKRIGLSSSVARFGEASHRTGRFSVQDTVPFADPDDLRAYDREYRKRRRRECEVFRENERRCKILRKYGITLEQYEALSKQQDGLCAICRQPQRGRKKDVRGKRTAFLCVDHDHQTGRVRGLLCNPCNVALGQLDDDTERLQRAIEYLRAAAARR